MKKVAIPLLAVLFGVVLASPALAYPPYSECQGYYYTSTSSTTGYSCENAEWNLYLELVGNGHQCPGPYYQACNVQFHATQACESPCHQVYQVTGYFTYGCEICVHPDCMP